MNGFYKDTADRRNPAILFLCRVMCSAPTEPPISEKGASLMTISGTLTTNLPKPIELQRAYQPPQTNAAQPQKPASYSRRFDSVTISGESGRAFAMEARSRLSNEVRTATSTASVAALREEIQQGTYPLDSRAIARNMLLWGD